MVQYSVIGYKQSFYIFDKFAMTPTQVNSNESVLRLAVQCAKQETIVQRTCKVLYIVV